MARLSILTQSGKIFTVTELGYIIREDMPDFKPSGQWIFVGIRHLRQAGTVFSKNALINHLQNGRPIDWLFKNGKGKWEVMDIDHGNTRSWGDRVQRIELVP